MMTNQRPEYKRFHYFIWFVWMPVSFFFAALVAYLNISEALGLLQGNTNPAAPAIFILLCILNACPMLAPMLVFFEFFRHRTIAWYLLMLDSVCAIVTGLPELLLNIGQYHIVYIIFRILSVLIAGAVLVYYWNRRARFGIRLGRAQDGAPAPPRMRRCPRCGGRIPGDSIYCVFCGKKLSD